MLLIFSLSRTRVTVNAANKEYNVLIEFVFIALKLKSDGKEKKNKKFFFKKNRIPPFKKAIKYQLRHTDIKVKELILLDFPTSPADVYKSVTTLSSYGALNLYLKINSNSLTFENGSPSLFSFNKKTDGLMFDGIFEFRAYTLIISLFIFLYYYIIGKIKGVIKKWQKAK